MALFPPLLNSYQSAFVASNEYRIYYDLPAVTSASDIGHIQIKIVYQSNNSILATDGIFAPDGIIYQKRGSLLKDNTNNKYYINLNGVKWIPNTYYKIQVRFGSNTTLWNDEKISFSRWKAEHTAKRDFSEWSMVMVTKAINKPEIKIVNQEGDIASTLLNLSASYSERSTTPIFYGSYYSDSNEPVNKYRFTLYEDQVGLLEDSGWLQHNIENDNEENKNADNHRFNIALTENKNYIVYYEIQTVNYYTGISEPYKFKVIPPVITKDNNFQIKIDNWSKENGCFKCYLNANGLVGNYVLTRASEKTNYTKWEDLKYFQFSALNEIPLDKPFFIDYTIESGVGYKYILKEENVWGQRLNYYRDYENNLSESDLDIPIRRIDFEHSYLYKDDIQLKLEYNLKLSSFKRTKLATKVDTIGSKYPTIMHNGYVDYAEFPISGLISINMDKDQTFIKWKEGQWEKDEEGNNITLLKPAGYYYKDELLVLNDRFDLNQIREKTNSLENQNNKLIPPTFSTALNDNNIFIERKFREKVEEFLSDGNYKLYKSPTEGNLLIDIINVSMTPNDTLGRMIFEFSGTAYEVGDTSIENLNRYGIINIGEYQADLEEQIKLELGQVEGLMQTYTIDDNNNVIFNPRSINVLDLIREKEEIKLQNQESMKYQIDKIRTIWFEPYPITNFREELQYLQAKIADIKTEIAEGNLMREEELQSLEKELQDKTVLNNAMSQLEKFSMGTIEIDNTTIYINENRTYHLEEINLSPNSTIYINYPAAMIVNYVYEISTVADPAASTKSTLEGETWGQIDGIFTETEEVLDIYNYNRTSDQLNILKNIFFVEATLIVAQKRRRLHTRQNNVCGNGFQIRRCRVDDRLRKRLGVCFTCGDVNIQ